MSSNAIQSSKGQVESTPWFFWLSDEYLQRKTFVSQFLRKMRRAWVSTFYPGYVQRAVQTRQGDCHRCGACCELVYKCPFLGRDGQNLPYCRVYGDLRPGSCKNYPFDRIDSEIEQCGFKFK